MPWIGRLYQQKKSYLCDILGSRGCRRWPLQLQLQLLSSYHALQVLSPPALHSQRLSRRPRPRPIPKCRPASFSSSWPSLWAAMFSAPLLPLIHTQISFTNDAYGKATSLESISEQVLSDKAGSPPHQQPPSADDYHNPSTDPNIPGRKANATFVFLARNGDLNGVVKSMKQVEDRFNKEFHYPYVFLNEEPFSEDFKQ